MKNQGIKKCPKTDTFCTVTDKTSGFDKLNKASTTYLYYTAENKYWVKGIFV
ncbi:MAG: hypothetical protein LBU22_12190 [Dysgonamonadaceae bacterium]|nr:hypothetical protein [Dysgonamonadaceae bacterium]